MPDDRDSAGSIFVEWERSQMVQQMRAMWSWLEKQTPVAPGTIQTVTLVPGCWMGWHKQ